MASNKIGDFDTMCLTNCQIKQTDYPIYYNTVNSTNGDSSESHKFFRRILKYFKRPTARIRRSKKKKRDINKRNVSTSKSEEKISVYTSLSSIANNVTKSDLKVGKLKQRMVDAITSTTRANNVHDKITHGNLLNAIQHLVHDTSCQYAVDNVVSNRDCNPLCIGSKTQNVDEEVSLETNSNAFAEACEKRRQTDFILEEITKISDALSQKTVASMKDQAASILASVSMAPTKYEMEEQTCENLKSLSSIIYADEEPNVMVKENPIVTIEEISTVAIRKKPSVMERIPTIVIEKKPSVVVEEEPTAAVKGVASATVMQLEIHKKTLGSSPNYFTPNSRDFSVNLQLDKSLSSVDIQQKSSIKDLRKTERISTITFPKKDDLRDTAAFVIAGKKMEEKEELWKKTSLRRMLDKYVFTDKINDENYVIINCIPKLKKRKSKPSDQPTLRQKDTQTDFSRQTVTKSIESSIKFSKMKQELTQRIKDIPQKSVLYKKSKYRVKFRKYMEKIDKKPELKKELTDSEKISKCFIRLPQAIRTCKDFEPSVKPTTVYPDCHTIEYLEPTRCCKDLSSIYLRPKYCDVWTTPCLTSEGIVNGAFPQDSCAIKYRALCHSLIDSSSRCYNYINTNCTKHSVFGNSLHNTYCKNDYKKYCYSHLNNIDSVQMGYYHCNDIQY